MKKFLIGALIILCAVGYVTPSYARHYHHHKHHHRHHHRHHRHGHR